MALHYDWGKTKAYEIREAERTKAPEGEYTDQFNKMHTLLNAGVHVTLPTGFPEKGPWEITEANAEEMYRRIYMVERVYGAMRVITKQERNEDVFFTPEDVKLLIGLKTNAGGKTTAKFNAEIIKRMNEAAARKWARAEEAATKAA